MGIPASGEWYENAVRNGLILPSELVVTAKVEKKVGGMTEAAFQKQVIEYAHLHGWTAAHFRRARIQRKNGEVYYETPVAADGKGFPDLLLVRDTVMIAAELKVGSNRVTPEQEIWLAAFRKVIGHVWACVWWPDSWPEIERVLGGPAEQPHWLSPSG